MENQENKSKYWIKKFYKAGWEDFRELEVGSVFEASVTNHKQMADRIGDIIFWYRTDKDKKGIYFITEVVSAPYPADVNTGYFMDLQVLKTIVNHPVELEKEPEFKKLIKKIDDKGHGGNFYNLITSDEPDKLLNLIKGNEKIELKKFNYQDINEKDLLEIQKIKDEYIKSDLIFNPFIDTNLAKSEVRHLNFITNLINPNGSHMQGNAYLKLFLIELLKDENLANNQELKNFCNYSNIKVQTEYNIGNGRIDMWLENDKFIIAIEGKTETEDSKGQLKKYDDYLKAKKKPYLLFYLTKYASKPKYETPDNLYLIGFNNTVLPFIKAIVDIEELPTKIDYIIDEYYNALITYIYNFTSAWNYDLDIINEITKDKENYKKYETIAKANFYDLDKHQDTLVEDVAKVFEYAKAKIERDFIRELSDRLDDDLEKKGFKFSSDSGILVNDFENNVDVYYDIKKIYEARKARIKTYTQDEINKNLSDILTGTGSMVCYEKKIDEENMILLVIQNDIVGLNVYYYHYINDELYNENLDKMIEIFDETKFHSKNISTFLDKEQTLILVEQCKRKILFGLKKMGI